MNSSEKKTHKIIKKALRIVLTMLIMAVLLPFLVAGLLAIPTVQQYAVQQAVRFGSAYLETEIKLQGLYIEPFKTIRLNKVLIFDQKKDTLLYVDILRLDLNGFDRKNNRLAIDQIRLTNAHFNLSIAEGDSTSNLQFLIDAFQTKTPDSSNASFEIQCHTVALSNLSFRFDNFNAEPRGAGEVDYNHVDISQFSGRLNNIIIKDSIAAELRGVHFKEKSGLILRYLNTHASFSKQSLRCNNLQLITNRSLVEGYYAMIYDSLSSFQHFFDEVELHAKLDSADVNFHDIAFFAGAVTGILTPMKFSGEVHGPLSSLKANISSLYFSNSGHLKGNVKLKGLPDPYAMLIDADVESLTFTAADIEMMKFPTGDGTTQLSLPTQIHNLGHTHFSGNYTGFINDFVAYGTIHTEIGHLITDINIKTGGGPMQYKGMLKSENFALGKMLGTSDLNQLAFDLNVGGSGLNLDDLQILAKGSIKRIDVLDYTYTGIDLDGTFANRIFQGNVYMDDPNAGLTFSGKIDLNEKLPLITCNSNFDNIQLGKLNLLPSDTFGVVSANLSLSMLGSDADDLNGKLVLENIRYQNQSHAISLDSIVLTDKHNNPGHLIKLKSDVVNAEFVGKTTLFDLPMAFIQIGNAYAPDLFGKLTTKGADSLQNFEFAIQIKNDQSLVGFIDSSLNIRQPIRLAGSANTANDHFKLQLDTISWNWNDIEFVNHSLTIEPDGTALNLISNADQFTLSGAYFLENLIVKSRLFNDTLLTNVDWSNQTSQADSGGFELLAFNSETHPINLRLNNLTTRIAGVTWESKNVAELNADSAYVRIANLDVRSTLGHITCNGEINPSSSKHLLFDVESFNLSYLSNFGISKQKLKGTFTGAVDLFYLNKALAADVDLLVDSLVIDQFSIGKIEGQSNYSAETQSMEMNLLLDYNGDRNVSFVGTYKPFASSDQLDAELSLTEFRAEVAEPFIQAYATEIGGHINGSVSVTGSIASPNLLGSLKLSDFTSHVQYLNTTYQIPAATITIEHDFFGFDHVTMIDEKGEQASLTATLFHENFNNLTYDIFVDAKNFLALNTSVADNPDYFGRANITGDINISGYGGSTDIVVEATTNKETKLSIPLQSTSMASDLDYIRFVPPKGDMVEKVANTDLVNEDLAGLSLDFQLTVNDNAEVQIIFDEKVGDVIKVRGNGDMLLEIDNKGKFNMYGDYTISGGDYLFTLQNIVNKRFVVQSGSKIVWSGSPTDAQVDLTAIYGLRASPYNLTASAGDTSAVYKKRMPVDVMLNMDGPLMEPDITFDVELTSLPESDLANQLLDPNTTNEQEMNQQVFALLLTNSFFSQRSGVSAISTTEKTSMEMVSNQLSNWISQYFEDFDFGVNYRPGDEISGNQTEVNVSKEFFNDRLFVEVNGSVQGANGNQSQTNNVAGEFNAEYKINKDGSLRARVFNEANNYNPTNLNQSPYTQGVGLFYRKEFDTWGGFFRNFFRSKGNEKKKGE